MTFDEKVKIAATARKLIAILDRCDDEEFVDEAINCVTLFILQRRYDV